MTTPKLPSAEEFVDSLVDGDRLMVPSIRDYRNAWLEAAAEVAEGYLRNAGVQIRHKLGDPDLGDTIRELKAQP